MKVLRSCLGKAFTLLVRRLFLSVVLRYRVLLDINVPLLGQILSIHDAAKVRTNCRRRISVD